MWRMRTRVLTIDLGNSRCKLCVWDAPDASSGVGAHAEAHIGARTEIEITPLLVEAALGWLAVLPPMGVIGVSSVAASELTTRLCQALRAEVSQHVHCPPDPDLTIECREPQSVGQDRLFAARGAISIAGRSTIVVDAGTALTIDAVRCPAALPGTRVRPAFLGGAIAPGPRLLAQALARGTARLPRIEPVARAVALGRDTREALQSGVVIGFRGAARELVARIASEADLVDAPVVLTGGARAFLLDPPVFGVRRLLEDGDLIHRGLLWACCPSTRGYASVP